MTTQRLLGRSSSTLTLVALVLLGATTLGFAQATSPPTITGLSSLSSVASQASTSSTRPNLTSMWNRSGRSGATNIEGNGAGSAAASAQ